jgi:hypothetical protein
MDELSLYEKMKKEREESASLMAASRNSKAKFGCHPVMQKTCAHLSLNPVWHQQF